MSFCGVLPPSLLSSVVFPCWFPGSFLEAGGAQQPLRPSEGLAGVVEPHLLVAVRFLPTREGSGTKSTGQVFFQYVRRWYAAIYGRIYWVVLGLRAPPAVTSAMEVFSQTFLSRFYGRAQDGTAVQFVDELFGKCSSCPCKSAIQSASLFKESFWYSQEQFQQR